MKLKNLLSSGFFFAGTILILFLLLGSAPAWSAVSVKQHATACVDSGTANSQKCSFSSNTTVGNFIWVSASAYPGNNSQNPNCTVSDDGRDSFIAATNNGQHTSGGGWLYIWGAQVATAGKGVTVSCTPASGNTMFITLDIFELTVGSSATWTFPDKGNGASGVGGTTLSVASFTPTNGNEIVVAVGTNDNNKSFSAGTNFTLGSNVISGQALATEYWIQTSATATTAPITEAGSDNWAEIASSISASTGSTAPSITSLSPTSGPTGTSVTIHGSAFGTAQGTVKFNGTAATPSNWTSTQIIVPVPNGATTGNVVVTAGGIASNGVNFTVTPAITSLSTSSGPVGTSVTITGTTLGSASGNTVTFNGTAATPSSWTSTQIIAPVPNGATTGNVVVTVSGNASNGANFTVTPAITSLSTSSGPVGTSVTITGTTLGSASGNTVTFNGTAAVPTSWTSAQIIAPVPNGATTGNVVVTVSGNASNGANFTVTPTITSLSPSSGPVGTSVTITGTTLGSASGNTVTFNGAAAAPTTWTSAQIIASVPNGATTGNVVVTVSGNASNGVNFTVSAPPPSLRTGTYFVNRTDDPDVPADANGPLLAQFCQNTSATDMSSPCSLREAVVEANGDVNNSANSPDTIMLGSGTYHLSKASAQTTDATTGHLDVTNPLTIVGAGNSGSSVTTIQADSTLQDQVFLIDALEEGSIGFPVAIRNLVIQGGQASPTTGLVSSGGAILWEAGSDGTGQLQLTNVTITGNNATDAIDPGVDDAGGIALFNTAPVTTPAQVNMSGSLIANNNALDAGGGIAVKGAVSLTMSNSTVTGNHAIGGGIQQGGGLFLCVCNNAPAGATSSPSIIQNSSISANTAGSSNAGEGGGIWTDQSLTINQGSSIQNNTGVGAGGGIATSLAGANDQVVISSSTITNNNTSGNGGGIEVDAGSNARLQLQFNRIVFNTAGNGGTGIANEGTGTVTAAENWWGCNQGPGTSPCDTAAGTGAVTFNPWITLSGTASPNPVLSGAPTTLTASFLQDSAGAVLSVTNLGPLIGLPISWTTATNGSLSNQQTNIQSNGTATATLTTFGGPTASAVAGVDRAATTVTVIVQDFSISITPAVQTVNVGSTGTVSYTITIAPINGFNGTVTLTCNQVTGESCTPATISGGSGTSNLVVPIPSAAGTYSFSVSGSTGSLSHSASATLVVADFGLSMSPPSITINAGQNAVYTVTCSSGTGFNGPVQLSTSFPGGGTFSLNPLNCPGSSGLTVTQSSSGTFTVPVSGTFGNASRNASATLVVIQDFSISLSPASQTVEAGNSATYTATVSSLGGFTGSVSLSCSGPAGLTVSCSPNPISVPSGGSASSTLTATPGSSVWGTFTLSATGTSGSLSHTATTTLTSQTPGTATVTVDGISGCLSDGVTCDYGALSVTVNGVTVAAIPYNVGVLPVFHASYLRNAINLGNNPYVTASCPPAVGQQTCPTSTIILTAKTGGSNTNYSLSVSSTNNDPQDFPQPGVTITASGPTLTGGH